MEKRVVQKQNNVITKAEESTDFFYKVRESVLKITGYKYVDADGVVHVGCLSLCDKLVYSVMEHRYSSFADVNESGKPKSEIYYDNQEDIALRIGIDRKTVERSIKKLCELGVVDKFLKSTTAGARKSASYVVYDLFAKNVEWFYEHKVCEVSRADVVKTTIVKQVKQQKPVVRRQQTQSHTWEDDYESNLPF